jgi:prevent-host-death family protein
MVNVGRADPDCLAPLDHWFQMTIIIVMQASVAQAKSQLADLLRRAERGEEVVIARHGLPVVRLVAIQRTGQPPVSGTPLDPKDYAGIDLDEPAFASWEKDGHASLD